MTTPVIPNCANRGCKHFIGWKGRYGKAYNLICKAFPKGIPEEIAYGPNLHLKPYPGDHGIQFEPMRTRDRKNGH